MTTVYLIRHSEPFKNHYGVVEANEELLFSNKKNPLSIYGEKLAETISKNEEFKNVNVVWSSDYVRCMSTAKYFAFENNLKVNISEQLGERIHGVSSWAELPQDFEAHQFSDENYKESFGESRKEATTRIVTKFNQILNENREKRIIIVAHSTIFAYLLSNWCEVSYDKEYKFENNVFFDGSWNYCETFKMTFDDTKLLSIENLKFN